MPICIRKMARKQPGTQERGQGALRAGLPWAVFLPMLLAFTPPASTATGAPLPNGAWGQLLSQYVKDGQVNYKEIVEDPGLLDQSLGEFEKISRQTYGKWNLSDQIAFWINAYNLFTISAIVDHYPPRGWNILYPRISIRQIGAVWGNRAYRTAGQLVSLSQIEHEILRGVFKEPRVHFALVCASRGCPPLPSVPFEGASLEQMLDRQVHAYLSDPVHGLRWDGENRTLLLSKIFAWYGEDFKYYYTVHKLFPDLPRERRAAVNFIWEYLPGKLRSSLKEKDFRISFLEYDWSLNGRTAK